MKTTFFGLTSFEHSMALQKQAIGLVEARGFPVILGFEYYPVVTLGKRAILAKEMIWSDEECVRRGISVAQTDRGGQATLHSPGQLVIYPLVPIRHLQISVRDFVALLEDSTMQWLKKSGIESHRSEDAGVFTENGKIAFIGIRVENGITRHGISINISNDLSLFSGIRACGQQDRQLDSLVANGIFLDLTEAFQEWVEYFTVGLLKLIRHPGPEVR